MFDRLKMLLGANSFTKSSSTVLAENGSNQASNGHPIGRPSNGLDQFFSSLQDRSALRILDFAGASQANVTYITSLGHSISSEDFMRSLELTFGEEGFYEKQSDPQLMDEFLTENLSFPADYYDGALVWDAMQFMTPHLLQITVDRLYDTLRPDAYMLAVFHSDEKAAQVPLYTYRIADHKSLVLTRRGERAQAQFFNNRALERLFHRFRSVKFFLTRDNLREILVRR